MRGRRHIPVLIALAAFALAALPRLALGATNYTVVNLTSQGNGLYVQRDYAGALAKYNQALAIDPNYDIAINNKALALIRLVRMSEAITAIEKAIQLKPTEKRYYLNAGKAYAHAGQYTTAIDRLTYVLVIDPLYVEALFNRGWCYDALGQYDQAIADYLKAANLSESYVLPRIGVAVTYAKQGKDALSASWLVNAVVTGNANAGDAFEIELARRNLGFVRGGDYAFTKSASPGLMNGAIRAIELQQYSAAITTLGRLATDEPSSAIVPDYHAWARTLANPSDPQIVTQLNARNSKLPAIVLDSTPQGLDALLNFQSQGAAPKTVRLLPGRYHYYTKQGSKIGFVDLEAGSAAKTVKLDMNRAAADIAKLVKGSTINPTPNTLQSGTAHTLNLRELMHVVAALQTRLAGESDFTNSNFLIKNIEGFFSNCDTTCTATISSAAAHVNITAKDASFSGSVRAFQFSFTDLETNTAAVEFIVDWESNITSGRFTLVLDPDLDDDGLIDTQESAYGCNPFKADEDNDFILDAQEVALGLDPRSASDTDADDDGDGVPNYGEGLLRTHKRDASSPASVYVDQASGSDLTGNGSSEAPYASIGKALVERPEGALAVHIGRGNYHENLQVRGGVALIGADIDATTITASVWSPVVSVPMAAKVVLKDMSITGARAYHAYSGAGVSGDVGAKLYMNHVCVLKNETSDSYLGGSGGGVSIDSGSLRMVRCIVRDNVSHKDGGGIYATKSAVTLLNSLISGNSAVSYGKAVYVSGGSLYARNLTVVRNEGTAFFCTALKPVISNCVFWGNSGTTATRDLAAIEHKLANNCFESGLANGSNGNFKLNPGFVDFARNDFHLSAASPCVDSGVMQGSILGDMDEVEMPSGLGMDRGCYEYNPALLRRGRIARYLLGLDLNPAGLDSNRDGKVNIADAITEMNQVIPGGAYPVSPADGATKLPVTPQLSWTQAKYASSYDLYAWKSSDTTPTTPIMSGITGTSAVTPPLRYNTQFTWRIAARNGSARMLGPTSKFSTKVQLVTVTSPNGGETWKKGAAVSVRYTAYTHTAGTNYRIELWRGATKVATLKEISTNTTGSKTETVTVPTTAATGSDYTVRVVSISLEAANAGLDAWDASDQYFKISF